MIDWKGSVWTIIIILGVIWAVTHLTGCGADYIVRCGLNRSYCN